MKKEDFTSALTERVESIPDILRSLTFNFMSWRPEGAGTYSEGERIGGILVREAFILISSSTNNISVHQDR